MKRTLLIIAAAAVFASAHVVDAATYYTSPSGSDSNPGTSAQPFRTIQRGANVLVPGDTLIVRSGTYAESFYDSIPGGASWSSPVVIKSETPKGAIIRPSSGSRAFDFVSSKSKYIELNGFVVDASSMSSDGIKITHSGSASNAAHHIRLRDVELVGSSSTGGNGILTTGVSGDQTAGGYNEFLNVEVRGFTGVQGTGVGTGNYGYYISTSNNLIEGGSVHDNGGFGIHVYKDSNGIANNVVRGVKVYNNAKTGDGRGYGIGLYSGSNHQAYNNLVWGNNGGITINYSAANAKVFNNTVYDNNARSGDHFGIYNGAQSSGASIRNNIVYQNSGGAVVNHGSATANTNLSSDPRFVNAAGRDFHLQSGSPAIDTGAVIADVPGDFEGRSRPQGSAYDIGAYEYATAALPPPLAQDVSAPTVPSGLTAAAVSTSQINLSWAASTDNVGVTGYRLYRNGAQVAVVSATSYQDTGLSAGSSYSYSVAAHDAAGNVSAGSAGASATTQAAPITPPSAPVPSGYIGSIRAGDMVKTLTKANVRSGSGTDAVKLGTQQANTQGAVIEGPVLGNNSFWWWKIDYSSGVDGWTADHLLRESPVQSNYPPDIGAAFKLGNYLRSVEQVNVRVQPSLASKLVGTQPAAATAMLTDGPIFADGHYWWKMDYVTGNDGWSSERYFGFLSVAGAENPAIDPAYASTPVPLVAAAGAALTDAQSQAIIEQLRTLLDGLIATLQKLLASEQH